MAKITLEYDTVAKTCAVACDGAAMDDLYEFTVSRSYSSDPDAAPTYELGVAQRRKDPTSKMSVVTRSFASQAAAGLVTADETGPAISGAALRAAIEAGRKAPTASK